MGVGKIISKITHVLHQIHSAHKHHEDAMREYDRRKEIVRKAREKQEEEQKREALHGKHSGHALHPHAAHLHEKMKEAHAHIQAQNAKAEHEKKLLSLAQAHFKKSALKTALNAKNGKTEEKKAA